MTYGKMLASIVYATLVAAYQIVSAGGTPTAVGWVQIGIAAATAVSVYLVPMTPQYSWVKSAVAAVLAVLQVLTTVVVGGVVGSEWLMIALAALSALGVYIAPATTGGTDEGEPTVSVGLGSDVPL